MNKDLTIGPIRFVLQGEGDSPMRYEDWAYRGFFARGAPEGFGPPPEELRVEVVGGVPERPATKPLFEAGNNWAVWPEGDGWLFCTGYAGRERPRATCRVTRELDGAVLCVDGDPGDAPLRYPLDQILTWGLLSRCGGVLMHAAVVVNDGVGVVLTGRSGAGKSTLAALCREQGWEVLNDDRAVLFFRDGEPYVAGTPWHGSGCFAEAKEVPLAGIHLLVQSRDNRIERLDPDEARFALLDTVSIPWFEDRWAQGAFDALDRLLQRVPVSRFYFTRTAAAADRLAEGDVPGGRLGNAETLKC